MTDTQWLRIQSFLNTCFGLYVGNEPISRKRCAGWCPRVRPLASVTGGRVREGELGLYRR